MENHTLDCWKTIPLIAGNLYLKLLEKIYLRLMEKIYLRLLENAKMTNVENKAKVIIKILPEYTKKLSIYLNSFKRDRSLIWVIRGKLLAVHWH